MSKGFSLGNGQSALTMHLRHYFTLHYHTILNTNIQKCPNYFILFDNILTSELGNIPWFPFQKSEMEKLSADSFSFSFFSLT